MNFCKGKPFLPVSAYSSLILHCTVVQSYNQAFCPNVCIYHFPLTMGKMFYDKSRKWFEEESIKGKEDNEYD